MAASRRVLARHVEHHRRAKSLGGRRRSSRPLLKKIFPSHSFPIMSLHLVKRLMFVLAAFAILSGAMASAAGAVASQAGVVGAMAGDDCLAMKMHMPCTVSKSGPCKMASSDCAKMVMCCDSLTGAAAQLTASVVSLGYISVSYDEAPAALRGRLAEPALFPPKAS